MNEKIADAVAGSIKALNGVAPEIWRAAVLKAQWGALIDAATYIAVATAFMAAAFVASRRRRLENSWKRPDVEVIVGTYVCQIGAIIVTVFMLSGAFSQIPTLLAPQAGAAEIILKVLK